MNFSEIFIKKPIMTMLMTVVILIFGMAAFFILPVSDLPVVDSPVITVNVSYPGASPDTMASTVASPLENEFTQIQGLQTMISNNTEGQTQILLTFELDRNVDLVAPDVQAAISRAAGNLPLDLPAPPSYQKTNPTDTPIMYLMVTSDTLTPGKLYDFGNKSIGQRLSMIDGVSQVQAWGSKSAVRVQLDPNKLAAYKIGINDIAQAVQNGTVIIPGGSLNGPLRAFSIEPDGQLLQAKDYETLIVAYRNNAPVRLKDIGNCIDSVQTDTTREIFGYANQKLSDNMVVLGISRATGANTVALAKRIRATIEELRRELPGSVTIDIFHDKSETIIESINDVKSTIIIALILVILVIFLFLGRISDTLIPSVTLPLTVIATFIAMYLMGFSLDNLSLMAIVLAIGFVVDDAIVVLENTVRLIEEGEKPLAAAIRSAKEITFTIVSMTLSLAVIFIPLVFMGGIIGRTFREFAVTVVLTIIISGVISLTLTPMMCARMLKKDDKGENKVEKLVNKYLGWVINKYGIALKWSLKHKFTMLVLWVFCLLGTVWFFKVIPQSFLPEGDSGLVMGQMMLPLGTSTDQIRRFQDKLNNIFSADPNVEKLCTITGTSPGADQSTGPFFIKLKPHSKRQPMKEVVKNFRKKTSGLPGGFVFLQAMPVLKMSTGAESTATGSKYSYVITGALQEDVYKAADKFFKETRKLPGFLDVQTSVRLDLPQLNLEINRDRASTLGLTASDIEYALAFAYAQGKLTTYKTDIDQYYVIIELNKKYQSVPENLSHLYLRSEAKGALVPLSSITKWSEGLGAQNVPHFNQLNAATISFNIDPSIPLGNATKSLEDLAGKILPPAVSGDLQGEAEQFKEAIASLIILIFIAIFIKYIILGILYESYVHPITIITTLPVATVGGLATLYIFHSELSLYAYIGIFMLLGIVAKNGIMMVDFANQNLEKGNTTNLDAIYNASVVRFRPILMTGVAAIMGALPIALGFGADGESRMPLGLVVVGGLIFSQVVTLFITPALFLYMQDFQQKYLDKFELTRSDSARKQESKE